MYCTECGRRLVGGRCPEHGASAGSGILGRPAWWAILSAAGLALALGAASLSVVALVEGRGASRRVAELGARVERVASELRRQGSSLGAIAARADRLARALGRELDPEAVAREASPSVFVVEAGGGQGSGFVVSSRPGGSTVLTNLHVVRDAWELGTAVVLRQGDRTYEGSVTAVSQAEDLAVISVPVRLPPLDLARREPRPGEEVVVVGAPLGLEHTVVTGVVSGHRGRHLQISAPVSPGDSGAPVLDASGRVVGVAVSKIVGVEVEGISFAIPVETLCRTVVRC
jgi:putative serine protease PepD